MRNRDRAPCHARWLKEATGGRAPAADGQVPDRFAPFGHSLTAVDGRWRGADCAHTLPRDRETQLMPPARRPPNVA
jgi:hypothetical protein